MAAALPLRPAASFCCVVPPWLALLLLAEPEPDFLPPRLEDPSEFAIAAARLLLIPFLCSAISLLTSAGDRPSGTVHPCRFSRPGTCSIRSVSR